MRSQSDCTIVVVVVVAVVVASVVVIVMVVYLTGVGGPAKRGSPHFTRSA